MVWVSPILCGRGARMTTKTLQAVAEVRAGHPFRGSVAVAAQGNASVVQMRDVSASGAVAWSQLARTALRTGRRAPDWLQPGDVLFAARGARNYAICLDEVPTPAVCAQYFFVLRCKPGAAVLPGYLAWYINRSPSQRYLASNAEGTDQLSIRRGVLEAMPVAVPLLAQQRLLVQLAVTAQQERSRLEALIRNREQQLDGLAQRLLAPA